MRVADKSRSVAVPPVAAVAMDSTAAAIPLSGSTSHFFQAGTK